MRFIFLLFSIMISLQAERIITLSPSLSEIVCALGKEQELVGVSSFATYPPSISKVTKIGGYFSPSLETIYALKPTLVIGQEYHQGFLDKLQKMGISTLILPLNSLKDIKNSIKVIALRLNTNPIKAIKAIDTSLKKAHNYPRTDKKILITYGVVNNPKRDTMFIAGQSRYFSEILKACGAQNAFSKSFTGEPRLHFEELLSINPDSVIMLSSKLTDATPNSEKIFQAWKNLPIKASKEGNIHILDQDYLLIPSQRVAQTIQTLCEIIQP
jgi:iron complex transport system substrate-binding protein